MTNDFIPPSDLTDYTPEPSSGEGGATARGDEIARPTARQLEFHDWQLGLFIHFGIETYTRQVSGDGVADTAHFNPVELDCENWIDAAVAMGARYVVYTARHEGGFCTWPTRTHDYSVAHCPWRGGRGDVVREYVDACRRRGLKVGFYHTPSHDAHCLHIYNTTHGTYNERYIQTQVDQMTELLTGYGPIDYLWFDHHKGNELYRRVDDTVRRLQPDCLMFGPDTWIVGGHTGVAEYPLWHAVDTADGSEYARPTTTAGDPRGRYYRCWEANTIFSGNWFWWGRDILPLENMIELYYQSVGRGANFLPNFAPDPRGLMTDEVLAAAKAFGDAIRTRFSSPIAAAGPFEGPQAVLDLPKGSKVNHIIIREDLSQGQLIAEHRVEILAEGRWRIVDEAQTIGPQRIIKLDGIPAQSVRVTCTKSLTASPRIRSLAAY
ncbi:MAG: alpha-L-fucosidase [Planctomycetaceae bacterium]|nr:alpha-L-fucosidase [Planctomycetaceae bacterium]